MAQLWIRPAQILLLFNLPASGGTLKFIGNDIRPPTGLRFFPCRVDCRYGYCRLLPDCRFRSNADRRADKPQRDFSNCCYEHHRCGNCRPASDIEDSWHMDRYINPILHPARYHDDIIFRWRRPVLRKSGGHDQSLRDYLGACSPASLPSECNVFVPDSSSEWEFAVRRHQSHLASHSCTN